MERETGRMRKYIAPSALALLVLLGVLAVVLIGRLPAPGTMPAQSQRTPGLTTASPQLPMRNDPTRVGPQRDVPGVPGIKPSMPGHVPAFTVADVHTYFYTHPLAPGVDDKSITSIQFIPSKQAVALMRGEPTGIADNELVCYVEFDNVNIHLNVPRPPGAQEPLVHSIQIVYNAATGNELVWGGN